MIKNKFYSGVYLKEVFFIIPHGIADMLEKMLSFDLFKTNMKWLSFLTHGMSDQLV